MKLTKSIFSSMLRAEIRRLIVDWRWDTAEHKIPIPITVEECNEDTVEQDLNALTQLLDEIELAISQCKISLEFPHPLGVDTDGNITT